MNGKFGRNLNLVDCSIWMYIQKNWQILIWQFLYEPVQCDVHHAHAKWTYTACVQMSSSCNTSQLVSTRPHGYQVLYFSVCEGGDVCGTCWTKLLEQHHSLIHLTLVYTCLAIDQQCQLNEISFPDTLGTISIFWSKFGRIQPPISQTQFFAKFSSQIL